ncbi:MAG: hypothetical protein WD768_17740 [Phycisphaeraceae bacterium]
MNVHELRRLWKPIKDRLAAQRDGHPTNIRFHRVCSWLQRVELIEGDQDLDVALTCRWIAFNAMYGQWNEQAQEPGPDRECWRRFMDRILKLDSGQQIESVLIEHKKLVIAIMDDNFLGSYFWRDPTKERAFQTSKDRRQAASWYIERRWALILEALLDRIYFMRCQLIHGAATFGSKLNRTSLRRCSTMLGLLLPATILVIINCGADEDWGPMCYPPVT